MPDMELHYRLAGSFSPDANLIGSATVITGQEMFGGSVPPEEPDDFVPPLRDKGLPLWVIVDSEGKLAGMLHTCRRFEYCRDVLLLVSDATPQTYINHLEERNYKYIRTKGLKADITESLSVLYQDYGVRRILTDTGQVLGNILLNLGLVDEVSLLIHPIIKGENAYNMFGNTLDNLKLTLTGEEKFDNGCVWVRYRVC